jgi:hypothetical protein
LSLAVQEVFFALVIYFLPTQIAYIRRRDNLGRFFLANLFFGIVPFGHLVLMGKALFGRGRSSNTDAPKRIRPKLVKKEEVCFFPSSADEQSAFTRTAVL